ncbi:MAG: tetratricopeptide (TPR) repeat protein [Polyangiales bacterium]|jgi:tetratricopeptide (TPR) repeat protein
MITAAMIRSTTLLLALLLTSSAFAQPQNGRRSPNVDAELDDAARITFQRARVAFDAGEYETALSRFRQAYELSPRPQLLYNIAATLDRLRRDVEAAVALRAFLEASPETPDRVEIEARIRVLDGIIQQREDQDSAVRQVEEQRLADDARRVAEAEAEAAAAAEEERRRQVAAQPEPSSGLHPAIAISVGGAALVAGGLIVWSGLDASSRNDTFTEYANAATPSPSARVQGQRLFDETRSAEKRTNALIGVAAALGVAAGVLFVFTDFGGGDDEEDGVVLRGGATHQGGSMILEGTF